MLINTPVFDHINLNGGSILLLQLHFMSKIRLADHLSGFLALGMKN